MINFIENMRILLENKQMQERICFLIVKEHNKLSPSKTFHLFFTTKESRKIFFAFQN